MLDTIGTFVQAHGGIFWTGIFLLGLALTAVLKGALGAMGRTVWRRLTGGSASPSIVSITTPTGAPLPITIVAQPPTAGPRVSAITYTDIMNALNSAKPLQRDSVADSYLGIYVKWDTVFWDAYREGSDKIRVSLDLPKEGRGSVYVDIKADDYRELFTMDRGHPIKVTGKIKKVDRSYVRLDDVSLEFISHEH